MKNWIVVLRNGEQISVRATGVDMTYTRATGICSSVTWYNPETVIYLAPAAVFAIYQK